MIVPVDFVNTNGVFETQESVNVTLNTGLNGDINRDCCDSLLICKAVVALDTRRDGLKAKRDGVDVEDDEGSV